MNDLAAAIDATDIYFVLTATLFVLRQQGHMTTLACSSGCTGGGGGGGGDDQPPTNSVPEPSTLLLAALSLGLMLRRPLQRAS